MFNYGNQTSLCLTTIYKSVWYQLRIVSNAFFFSVDWLYVVVLQHVNQNQSIGFLPKRRNNVFLTRGQVYMFGRSSVNRAVIGYAAAWKRHRNVHYIQSTEWRVDK